MMWFLVYLTAIFFAILTIGFAHLLAMLTSNDVIAFIAICIYVGLLMLFIAFIANKVFKIN